MLIKVLYNFSGCSTLRVSNQRSIVSPIQPVLVGIYQLNTQHSQPGTGPRYLKYREKWEIRSNFGTSTDMPVWGIAADTDDDFQGLTYSTAPYPMLTGGNASVWFFLALDDAPMHAGDDTFSIQCLQDWEPTPACHTGKVHVTVHLANEVGKSLQRFFSAYGGIYILEAELFQGYPVYKHSDRRFYLYHSVFRNEWKIGSVTGRIEALLRAVDSARRPEQITTAWYYELPFDDLHTIVPVAMNIICTGRSQLAIYDNFNRATW